MPDPCLITDPEGRTWRAPSLASADREAVRWGGFAAFARRALPQVPMMRDPIWSWHLDEMANHAQALFEGRCSILVVNVPPGSTKSALLSILFPAWIWTVRPEYQIMSASFDPSLAKAKQAGWTMHVMQSAWFQERWGDLLLTDTNQGEYYTRGGGYRYATSPKGKGTGRHCDMYTLDDPIKPAEVEHLASGKLARALEVTNGWINHSVITRATSNDQRILCVMQRLHENDPSGFLKEHFAPLGGFCELVLPFEFEPDRRCVTAFGGDRRYVPGEVLIPRLTRKAALLAAGGGGRMGALYQAQMQQNPTPTGGVIFKPETFGEFDPAKTPFRKTLSVLCIDATFGKTHTEADYVAIEAWGYFQRDFLCYHSFCERMSFLDSVQAIEDLMRVYPAHFILIEDAANGPAIIETLLQKFPNVIALPTRGGKEPRARAASHVAAAGHMKFDKTAPWYEAKAANLARFPNGKHDDDVDATTHAITWMLQEFASGADYGDAIAAWNEERSAAAPPARDPNDPGPRPSLFL